MRIIGTIACALAVLGGGVAPAGARLASPWQLAAGEARSPLLPSLRLEGSGTAVASPQARALPARYSERRRYVVPVLLSVLVPGGGEIATGHWLRGLPLVLGDVATWLGHANYNKKGRDWRNQYESFADDNWAYGRWQANMKEYGPPWYEPTDAADSCSCVWISRSQDKQHYYENIGKYPYFWSGWDEYDYNPTAPYGGDSPLRRQYDDLRIRSNNSFDIATNLLTVAMATRLLSVAQSVFLVRGDLARERLSLATRPRPGLGSEVELTFKY